jgi:arylsulfatase A
VQEGIAGLALRSGEWKYIPPHKGPPKHKDMRSGNGAEPQLYQLSNDPAETNNLAAKHPDKVKELAAMLDRITGKNIPAPEPHDFK